MDCLTAGVAGNLLVLTVNRLQGSASGFLSGITSMAFLCLGYDRKTAGD